MRIVIEAAGDFDVSYYCVGTQPDRRNRTEAPRHKATDCARRSTKENRTGHADHYDPANAKASAGGAISQVPGDV